MTYQYDGDPLENPPPNQLPYQNKYQILKVACIYKQRACDEVKFKMTIKHQSSDSPEDSSVMTIHTAVKEITGCREINNGAKPAKVFENKQTEGHVQREKNVTGYSLVT